MEAEGRQSADGGGHAISDTCTPTSTDEGRYHGDSCVPPEVVSDNGRQCSMDGNNTLADQALRFLSNASNETLGACLVGLGATTYFVLGRVGLVLIGVVGGVAIHASWENGSAGSSTDEQQSRAPRTRREPGVKVAERLLEWRDKKYAQKEKAELPVDVRSTMGNDIDRQFSKLPPATSSALSNLADAIIKDYVKFWYSPILPAEASFPLACQQTLRGFLLSISSHLSRKRPADSFLDFLTNSSSIIIVFLNELSSAISSSSQIPLSAPNAVLDYLEANPDSNLANLLSQKHQQRKLVMVAEDVLQTFVEPSVYACLPVRAFLREILAGVILEGTIQTCSQAEWINGWIVSMLEEGEPEIMNAIDAGVAGTDGKELESVKQRAETTTLASVNEETLKGAALAQEKSQPGAQTNKAEAAMEAAMREAQRLNEMIAEEDARRRSRFSEVCIENFDTKSESTTRGTNTPTSSTSDGVARAGKISDNSTPSILMRDPSRTPVDGIASSEMRSTKSSFIDYEQQLSTTTGNGTSDGGEETSRHIPLSLLNASITLFDDSMSDDRRLLRSKPGSDYLIQIEPALQKYPGWMIARKYVDFETLHEVMRRISMIAGIPEFGERYRSIPTWKGNNKPDLRLQLEVYLRTALTYRQLAESEGMKRFLDKDQGLDRMAQGNKSGFSGLGWPNPAAFETMGKGMLDVLSSAPKNAADGGKTLLGGVTGVFGGVGGFGPKRQSSGNPASGSSRPGTTSAPSLSRADSQDSFSSLWRGRDSQDNGWTGAQRELPQSQMEASRASHDSLRQPKDLTGPDIPLRRSLSGASDMSRSRELSDAGRAMHLPPPPSEISDDYTSPRGPSRGHLEPTLTTTSAAKEPSESSRAPFQVDVRAGISSPKEQAEESSAPESSAPSRVHLVPQPITEQETQVAVELIFAVINELYTLSSAWNIRRTLLTAAKAFLLRPGNPNLEAIRVLLQESVIEANTSDEGIAKHLRSIRENVMPTEDERGKWPPPKSEKEKEELRRKARKLLVERGMPQALTSVMGAAASGEALGRVFDCLQVEQIARGLIFGLLLQAVRAIAQ